MVKVPLKRSSLCLLQVICGAVAGCYTTNLGPQPKGLAQNYNSSQQPTTVVCVFVYGEVYHSNPLCSGKYCGRFDSACEGCNLKGIQHLNIKLYTLHCQRPA